jgi:site-specific DNA recombinase
MKTKMDELEARKVALTAALTDSPGPPALRQPPALSALYRAKIANLASALSDPSVQRDATETLRGLVFEIRMIPDPEAAGGQRMELVGELASILSLAEGRNPQTTRPPHDTRVFVGVRSVSMATGACNRHNPSRSCPGRMNGATQAAAC